MCACCIYIRTRCGGLSASTGHSRLHPERLFSLPHAAMLRVYRSVLTSTSCSLLLTSILEMKAWKLAQSRWKPAGPHSNPNTQVSRDSLQPTAFQFPVGEGQ